MTTSTFIKDTDGAVTVDWVVLTAALTGLAVAMSLVISGGVSNLSNDINDELTNTLISTSFDPDPSPITETRAWGGATTNSNGNCTTVWHMPADEICGATIQTTRDRVTLEDGTVLYRIEAATYDDSVATVAHVNYGGTPTSGPWVIWATDDFPNAEEIVDAPENADDYF